MGGRKRRAVNPQPVEYLQLFDPELRRFRGTILSRITLFHEERCKGDVSFLQRASLTRTDTGFAPLYLCGVLLFVEQKSKFFLLINHSKYSVEISKDTGFYRSDHFANWESFLPVPISTTFFGRFDCAISPRTENWTTRFQVSFQQWVVVSPSFHFHSRKTDISTYVYEVARNSYSIDRFLFEPRWIYLEVKERNNGEEGETGGEGPGNKESFTFFHFPRRIKGEEPWKEGKGRRRQKRNIVGKWKGIETLHARSPPPVSSEAE